MFSGFFPSFWRKANEKLLKLGNEMLSCCIKGTEGHTSPHVGTIRTIHGVKTFDIFLCFLRFVASHTFVLMQFMLSLSFVLCQW